MTSKARITTTIGLLLLIALVIGACSTEPATDPETDYQTALAYKAGNGVEQDSTQAMDWLKKAGRKGHITAQYELGQAYWQRGLSHQKEERVEQDFTQGIHWWKKAAEQGHADAQFQLGRAYKNGAGVEQDFTQAAHWWRKAAEQGDAWAQYLLGLAYEIGEGVPKNFNQATHWYSKGAMLGHPDAQFALSGAYLGEDRDITDAYAWLIIAKANGALYTRSRQIGFDGFEEYHHLTPTQITQAKIRAKELQKQIQANIAERDQAN
ncbi:MAG: tetratricopeptide repeat protein [Bacteroidetes bacterium]|nr:tetratricopeptide repeat protein [Bacteroidota bacterium]